MAKVLKLSLFCIFLLCGCKVVDEIKKELYVKISTDDVTQVSYTVAVAGGNVTDDGGKAVTEKGICYSTTPGPTTGSSKISLGTGMGPFSGNILNLTNNTKYYYRAYCINALGTSYGEEKSFTTRQFDDPIIETINGEPAFTPELSVYQNTITPTLIIKNPKNIGLINSAGFYYSQKQGVKETDQVSLPDSKDIQFPTVFASGSLSIRINSLTPGTTYFVKAFVKTTKGLFLGNEISIKTQESPVKLGLSSGLQVFYPFNGNANDESGNQKNGIVYGATLTKDRFGASNTAYSFNGVPGTKIQTNYPGVLGNNSRTISLWVRRPQQAFNGSYLLTWGTQASGTSFGLFMSGRDKTQFFGVDNGGSSIQSIFNSLWDGNWHHYVVVYDTNTGKSILNVKTYIDGVYYPIDENWNPQNINTTQGINMVIGEYSSAQSDWRTTNGEIDDVGVWNRVLSNSEIQYLYQNNYKP